MFNQCQQKNSVQKYSDPEVPRDIEISLSGLKDEVEGLDNAISDLVRRLSRVTSDAQTGEMAAPTYGSNTSLGSDLCALSNRLADMRRVVRSYVNNLGV